MLWLLLGVFLFLLTIGLPVAYSLGLAAVAFVVVDQAQGGFALPWQVIPQTMTSGVATYALLVIPLFVFVGDLMNRGGITERLVRFATALVGHVRGGLAHVVVAVNLLMAGMSGSAIADASSAGSVLIPTLKKAKYDSTFAAALCASSSTMGPIFPPSAPLAIVGALVGVSVGSLFIGGIVPAMLMAIALALFVAITARKRGYPKGDDFRFTELLRASRYAFMTFLLPLFLVGSILVGIATPTEAATMGVVYAIILGVSYRALRIPSLFDSLVNVGILTAVILFVVSTANTLGVLAGLEGFGPRLTEGLLAISDNPIILLFIINGAMLILGLAIEPLPLTLVLLPLLFPVVTQVGIDPIHFGIVITLNLMLALLTPPVAMLTFITASIADADVGAAMRASLPMFWTLVGVLVLITLFPDLVTWLPRLMQGS